MLWCPQLIREDASWSLPEALRIRLLMVQSQTLTSCITSFARELELRYADPLYVQQLESVGFLAHFERYACEMLNRASMRPT